MDIEEYLKMVSAEDYEEPDFDHLLQDMPEDGDDDVDEPEQTEETDPEPETEPEQEQEQETEPEQEPEQEPEPEKPHLTEENARFAEQRRQQQIEKRVQEQMQSSPEYQLAQQLAKMSGKPVDALLNELQEAYIAEQAKTQNVPVEVIRKQQELEAQLAKLQQENNMSQFMNWKSRVDAEAKAIQSEFPMLVEADIMEAQNYLLQVVRNPDMPLEQAVHAVHGKKIADYLKEKARTDALAEISGRKKSAVPPQGSKTVENEALTSEERYIAKSLGMSEEEYKKWKN